MKSPILFCATILTLVLGALNVVYADSATWSMNPTSGDWNDQANWTPPTVPNGPSDTATFTTSNTTEVSLSANTEISGIVFNPTASAFMISPNPVATLTISGSGITNNSAAVQNFMTSPDADFNHATILFTNTASAGDQACHALHVQGRCPSQSVRCKVTGSPVSTSRQVTCGEFSFSYAPRIAKI